MSAEKKTKLIEERIDALYQRLESCDICPRNCKVDRLKDKLGFCGCGKDLKIYTAFLHQGEEPGISEGAGSGTIFFSGCNLQCVYCQNYKFSCEKEGKTVGVEELAKIMLDLQDEGAVNINFVTPTHFLPQTLKALVIALKGGLDIPIVYNTSGFEKLDIISQLEGIVDIYLTDFKYITKEPAERYSNTPDYAVFASRAIEEMYRQSATLWDKDILKKGLIIRHLVLPGYIDESKQILSWITKNTPEAYASVMFQYRPYYKAENFPEINRSLKYPEYLQIKEFAESIELNGWLQEFNPNESLAGVHFSPKLEK